MLKLQRRQRQKSCRKISRPPHAGQVGWRTGAWATVGRGGIEQLAMLASISDRLSSENRLRTAQAYDVRTYRLAAPIRCVKTTRTKHLRSAVSQPIIKLHGRPVVCAGRHRLVLPRA